MSGPKRAILLGSLLCLMAWGGCGDPGVGDACGSNGDCPGKLCLSARAGFGGGYCSSDCSQGQACGAGQSCVPVGNGAACLLRCRSASECRDSTYQCYQGVCQPACKADADCHDPGFVCHGGTCAARPGAPEGAACLMDSDCSSDTCVDQTCVRTCDREPACGSQTCVLDRDAATLRSYCTPPRTGAAALQTCRDDTDCDRGSCLMGACLLLCQTAADCGGSAGSHTCSKLPAPLNKVAMDSWPAMKVCLPRNQDLPVSLGKGNGKSQTLLVPDAARSVLITASVPAYSESYVAGLALFADASGAKLYGLWDNVNDPLGYFRNPIRHYPDTGCSTFYLSSSPHRAPAQLGAYTYQTYVQDSAGNPGTADVRAIYKLYDAPQTTGKVPLRVHITDMSGLPPTCQYRTLNAANAASTLSVAMARLKEIYAQATVQIDIDPITFDDSDAPAAANSMGGIGQVLSAATQDSSGGIDVVLVRSISPNGVLGVAGGIPGSPGLAGTPHTGAVVTMAMLCIPQLNIDQKGFAATLAHELGHTLGLSHNREQNGQSDPLGDGSGYSESYLQNTDNLMYWAEGQNPGAALTAEQGEVLRGMPQVLP